MPPLSEILLSWKLNIPALLLAAVVLVLYVRGLTVLSRGRTAWNPFRTVAFVTGLLLFLYLACGFPGVYAPQLRWAFILQLTGYVFVVPLLLGAGRPLSLARLTLGENGRRRVDAFMGGRPVRFLSHPVVAPLLGLALFASLLGPGLYTMRSSAVASVLLTLLAPLLGLLLVLPALEGEERPASSAVMVVAFIYVFIELLADAIPGIMLRLSPTVLDGVTGAVQGALPWFPGALRDQQLAGDLLWFVAEVVDLPLIILMMVRFQRADRADARRIDELSDEELEELNRRHLHRG
ncbi:MULTISPECIES: cytochrome c oxidase assembly protein [Arthrobacter]|uniref:Cytochrome c oxidase assembly protein n=2 Tax=Arthrobacter TaxID=1663 RepID=A0ABU9KL59_9MICC|nr:cytochrome c oxidase assembly protein [Arthrobacter sp. YJM1]MDP5227295.1 cytochrome c oxidase assembly protein [Arthrobacter sp. YJM1]